MSLAMRLKLPTISLNLGGLVGKLKAAPAQLKPYLIKHRKAALMLWIAFLGGLAGADLWFTHQSHKPLPVAAVELGPIPMPLMAGRDPVDRPLSPAPNPALVENSTEGKLPTIGPNGMAPYQAYAYPFDASDARPRISIVLTNVGLQSGMLATAIRRLPGSVALAFNPYTPALDQALAAARQAGHETMLMVPADGLNPENYDPGPGALRSSLTADENIQRLRLIMGRGAGYVGLLLDPHTSVLASPNLAGALLTEGQKRGLELLSANDGFTRMGLAQGSPTSQISVQLDDLLDPAAADKALAELEQRARESGHAIAITALYPFMIDKLANWLPTLADKGIAIAPVSAAVQAPQSAAPAQDTPQETQPAGDPHADPAMHH